MTDRHDHALAVGVHKKIRDFGRKRRFGSEIEIGPSMDLTI